MHRIRVAVLLLLALGSSLVLAACGSSSADPAANANPVLPLATEARARPASSNQPVSTPARTPRAPTATRASAGNGLKTISRAELPQEAYKTLELIQRGGPFPYRQDGQVFQNREGVLPGKQSGYYHEYTVETPGSDDRGARRIVTGANGEYYYTSDHYVSFRIILDP